LIVEHDTVMKPDDDSRDDSPRSFLPVFLVSLKLGLTCFGGPVAHLGYFHQEFVVRRKWLLEHEYADLVALCQFLPGPASSQVNMAIGMLRAKWPGALAAWLGFTAPSALLMIAFAYGVGGLGDLQHAGWLNGLKLAAVAVVAQAVWTMATKFCAKPSTALIAFIGAMVLLFFPFSITQLLVIAVGSAAGWMLFRHDAQPVSKDDLSAIAIPYRARTGVVLLVLFAIFFVGLPLLKFATNNPAIASFDAFYRTGSLVFGGGHVVLPLLRDEVVKPGWISDDRFLAGYGAAQALPGPLFTFSAFLGAAMKSEPQGWIGGLWCLVAIFLPSVFLVFGVLPFWDDLRKKMWAQAALRGANAAVVGVLLSALYNPVWTSSVHRPRDFAVALIAFLLLMFVKCPPWIVVIFSALAGAVFLG
jgi:chromate transporter